MITSPIAVNEIGIKPGIAAEPDVVAREVIGGSDCPTKSVSSGCFNWDCSGARHAGAHSGRGTGRPMRLCQDRKTPLAGSQFVERHTRLVHPPPRCLPGNQKTFTVLPVAPRP